MKLSEMDTRQLAAALCSLAAPIDRLCADKDVMAVIATIATGKGSLAAMLGKAAPVLLDKHYDDVVAVLAALTGKTADEISAQSGMQTIADIRACLDQDLGSFFSSSAPTGKTPA